MTTTTSTTPALVSVPPAPRCPSWCTEDHASESACWVGEAFEGWLHAYYEDGDGWEAQTAAFEPRDAATDDPTRERTVHVHCADSGLSADAARALLAVLAVAVEQISELMPWDSPS